MTIHDNMYDEKDKRPDDEKVKKPTGKEIVDTFDESSGEYSRRSYLQTVVVRYLRGAKKTMNNVCKGQFP